MVYSAFTYEVYYEFKIRTLESTNRSKFGSKRRLFAQHPFTIGLARSVLSHEGKNQKYKELVALQSKLYGLNEVNKTFGILIEFID